MIVFWKPRKPIFCENIGDQALWETDYTDKWEVQYQVTGINQKGFKYIRSQITNWHRTVIFFILNFGIAIGHPHLGSTYLTLLERKTELFNIENEQTTVHGHVILKVIVWLQWWGFQRINILFNCLKIKCILAKWGLFSHHITENL